MKHPTTTTTPAAPSSSSGSWRSVVVVAVRLFLSIFLVTSSPAAAAFLRPSQVGGVSSPKMMSSPSLLLLLRAGSSNNDNKKYVLVTGANKGIGKAICQNLLENYPEVSVLLGSRDQARGDQAAKDLLQATDCSEDRLHVICLDTSSEDSIQEACQQVQQLTPHLYGIVNNAGILQSNVEKSVQVNYFGPRRVNDAFIPLLLAFPGQSRIVNIGSASGPMFVSSCRNSALKQQLAEPWTISVGISELDEIALDSKNAEGNAYGFSKALVAAYTWWLAHDLDDKVIVNAVTPGWIATDMTAGQGATNPPSKGAEPPVWLLMNDDLTQRPTGRYYGSDCQRSPLDRYRGPGDPVYQGPDGK